MDKLSILSASRPIKLKIDETNLKIFIITSSYNEHRITVIGISKITNQLVLLSMSSQYDVKTRNSVFRTTRETYQ